jgi:hypothetical protein
VDPFRSPLVESFRQGGVPADVRLQAARGLLAPSVPEQLQLLMLLALDADEDVASVASATISRLPPSPLAAFLEGPDVPSDVRDFYANRGWESAARGPRGAAAVVPAAPGPAPLEVEPEPSGPLDAAGEGEAIGPPPGNSPAAIEADPERRGAAQRLAMLTVADRMKTAMQGTREERSILIRDPNRLVSSAVLSSPKLTESEVEAIARMTNVSDDVLRVLGSSRLWTKNYGVVAALTRNPKTPVGVALTLLPRLSERDVKMLSTDRNVPEPVRLSARKLYTSRLSRRE